MSWILHTRRTAVVATATIAMLTFLTAGTAAAHEGHEHAQAGGFDANVIVQAGATAASVAIIYLLSGLVFRYRDRHRGDRSE
jgi:hypothetical protein